MRDPEISQYHEAGSIGPEQAPPPPEIAPPAPEWQMAPEELRPKEFGELAPPKEKERRRKRGGGQNAFVFTALTLSVFAVVTTASVASGGRFLPELSNFVTSISESDRPVPPSEPLPMPNSSEEEAAENSVKWADTEPSPSAGPAVPSSGPREPVSGESPSRQPAAQQVVTVNPESPLSPPTMTPAPEPEPVPEVSQEPVETPGPEPEPPSPAPVPGPTPDPVPVPTPEPTPPPNDTDGGDSGGGSGGYEPPHHTHSYQADVTKAADCGSAGVKTYTCSGCGKSYTETIPATGDHSYISEVTTPASCVADGEISFTCSVCGEHYTETIPATGEHTYVSEIITPAGCGTDGEIGYTCSACGKGYTEILPATGEHDWGAWTDTGDPSGHSHTCPDCGTQESAAHAYDAATHLCVCGKAEPGYSAPSDIQISGANGSWGTARITVSLSWTGGPTLSAPDSHPLVTLTITESGTTVQLPLTQEGGGRWSGSATLAEIAGGTPRAGTYTFRVESVADDSGSYPLDQTLSYSVACRHADGDSDEYCDFCGAEKPALTITSTVSDGSLSWSMTKNGENFYLTGSTEKKLIVEQSADGGGTWTVLGDVLENPANSRLPQPGLYRYHLTAVIDGWEIDAVDQAGAVFGG